MLAMIYLAGAIGVALMLVYRFGGNRAWGICGQIFLMVSFGLIAFALIRAKSYVIGGAAAIAVIVQIYATVAGSLRERRTAYKKSG